MASHTSKIYCLFCSTIISTPQNKINKEDVLFLLRILLEIPPESQIIYNIKSSINLLQLCDKCLVTVNHCKQMYAKVLETIEKFWDFQNELLENINDNPDYPKIPNDFYNSWANQCRKFVQHHDFAGFGYPFIIHDLDSLTIHSSPAPSIKLPSNISTCAISKEYPSVEHPHHIDNHKSLSYPVNNLESVPIVKEPVNLEIESNDEDNCVEYDIHQNPLSSSEEERDSDYQQYPRKSKPVQIIIAQGTTARETVQGPSSRNTEWMESYTEYDFRLDPITGKFHCLDPLCSKSAKSKHYMTNHYEVEHLKIKEKKTFNCNWPGCGKIIGDKQSWQVHMDKHRGTPRTECKECGHKFYWRKELVRHQRKVHGEIGGLKGDFICEVARCRGKRLKSRLRWKQHMDLKHKGCLKEICGGCGQRFNWRLELIEHQKQFGH